MRKVLRSKRWASVSNWEAAVYPVPSIPGRTSRRGRSEGFRCSWLGGRGEKTRGGPSLPLM